MNTFLNLEILLTFSNSFPYLITKALILNTGMPFNKINSFSIYQPLTLRIHKQLLNLNAIIG